MKGIAEPVPVFEVTGLGPLRTPLQRSAGRGLTKFVGRQSEIEAITRAAEHAQSGRGQIVAVVAEPGVGKSRLFHEFKLASQDACSVIEAHAIAHGKTSAYLPLIELLNSYFEISSADDLAGRRRKITDRLHGLDPALLTDFRSRASLAVARRSPFR